MLNKLIVVPPKGGEVSGTRVFLSDGTELKHAIGVKLSADAGDHLWLAEVKFYCEIASEPPGVL